MRAPRTYLLVDDNPGDRLLAEEAFERLCPDCVLTCMESAGAALEFLQNERAVPDVVLLDLNMPGMNGFQLLQALKEDARLAQIPVIILSTSSAQQDVARAYTLHASSYLVKSVDFARFLAQLERILRYWQVSRTMRDVGFHGET